MKKLTLLVLLISISNVLPAQFFEFSKISGLSSELAEVSGILYLNGKLIGLTDSGGGNTLYEINISSGIVERKVTINNAINKDWEDICADSTYIYIGDIGNNANGNRQDLTIYRILISDYENTANTSVNAETIHYKYHDQTNFFGTGENNTDYDAEALIAYNDSLYIFTKNWLNYECNIYSIPKNPNNVPFDSKRIDSFNANGLVTGADYNALSHDVTLSAYNLSGGILSAFAYVIKLSAFNGNHFSEGKIISRDFTLPLFDSPQIEGVTFSDSTHYYLTSEVPVAFPLPNWLGTLSWDGSDHPVPLRNDIRIGPNPSLNLLYYVGIESVTASIYNYNGQLVQQSTQNPVNISHLNKGVYVIRFTDNNGNMKSTQTLVKQ